MQFMIIRKADAETEAGAMPSEELIRAMTEYNESMAAAGILRGGDGLKPSSKGARIIFRGGKPNVVDGPFAETKELVAGFTIIEVASLDEAIEWVKKWPAADADGNVELELRPFVTPDDFGGAFTEELREREAAMFSAIADKS